MKYSHIISDFTWSYSRIKQFELCPYAFLLNYIKHSPERKNFFSQYGSFAHKLLESYLKEELNRGELPIKYILDFKENVDVRAPSQSVFNSYFTQGLDYFKNIDFPYKNLLAVEQEVNFSVDGIPFTGFIDAVPEDNGLIVLDHKSRTLKPRSKRKKPTASDEELDAYIKQLFLYGIAIKEQFHEYPTRLEFNCFRSGQLISEPFTQEGLEKTKIWAVDSVKTITENEDWSPKLDYWKCRYICSQANNCCYFQMNKR